MAGEVTGFDLGAVVRIHVVALDAPADYFAGFGFGASAFAMWQRRLPLVTQAVGAFLLLRTHRFRDPALLLGLVLRARAKLDGALAVVVALHGQAADAFAVFAALPIVPLGVAIMSVHQSAPTEACSPHGRPAA